MYGPGGSYHVFAGKDGSRGLAKSSLNVEDAVEDTTGLEPAEERTLQQWYDFFEKVRNFFGQPRSGHHSFVILSISIPLNPPILPSIHRPAL
jgi:hypothetical protein